MTYGSFCTGVGGIDLGMDRAGFRCRWQVEIDSFCCRVLEKHWPGVKRYGDIKGLTGSELEPVDLICGGYPCQPFSQAGKRGGTSDPRHLWPEFARIFRVLRPRYILLENVPGHLSLGFGGVLGDLAGLGYDAEWLCLRASDFGAAHLRKRVFIVAYRPRRGFGELREPSGGNGFLPVAGRGPQERNGTGPAGAHVPDASGTGLPESEREAGYGAPGNGQGPTATELCGPFAPGPGDPRWPAIIAARPDLAPALGGRLGPRFVELLQGFPIGWTEIEDADAKKTGPGEGVRRLRKATSAQAVQWNTGGHERIPAPEVLRQGVHGDRNDQGRSDQERLPVPDSPPTKISMRDLRNQREATDPSSQGPELAERQPGEHSDLVLKLSHLVASCRRGDCSEIHAESLQILQTSEFTSDYLQLLPDADQNVWQSLSDEDRQATIVEATAWAAGMSDRTKRLGRLGNAVVPQVAEYVARRILEFDGID